MKLRLKGNTLRLRLDQEDLTRFAAEGRVEATTKFGDDTVFRYVLRASSQANGLTARATPGQIAVHVPAALADEWTQTDRVGLEAQQPVGEGQALRILVEKDLGCQHRSAHEEGMFGHLRSEEPPPGEE